MTAHRYPDREPVRRTGGAPTTRPSFPRRGWTRSLQTSSASRPTSRSSPPRGSRSTSSWSATTSRSSSTPGCSQLFPLVSAAVGASSRSSSLRWISFSHVEADECGSMNEFLAGRTGCPGRPWTPRLRRVAQRPGGSPAVAIEPDGVLVTGSHRMRFLATPHVPHNWESGLWFDETDRDVVRRRPVHVDRERARHGGGRPGAASDHGGVDLPATSMGPRPRTDPAPPRRPGPRTLAIMHGSSYAVTAPPSC